jgi:O-antigen/teichoic acid export membrane protein
LVTKGIFLKIVTNYFYQIVLQGINILFPIITFPYVARILAPEGIGEAQYIFSIAQYFTILAGVGIPVFGIKELAKYINTSSESRVLKELFTIQVFASTIFTVIFAIVYLIYWSEGNYSEAYLIAGAMVLLSCFNLDWVFNAYESFRLILFRSALVKVLVVVLLFVFVTEPEDVQIYVMVLVFSFVGQYLLNASLLRSKLGLIFNIGALTKYRTALSLIVATLLATMMYTTLDVVLVGALAGKEQAGFYVAAIKICKVIMPVINSLAIVLIPRTAQQIAASNSSTLANSYRLSFDFICFLSIPIAAGVFLLSESITLLYAGPPFLPAAGVLSIVAVLPVLLGFGHFFAFQVLVPLDMNKAMFRATAVGIIIFLLINYILLPVLGAKGAGIAIVATEAIVTFLYVMQSPKHVLSKLSLRPAAYAMASTVPFFIYYYFISVKFDQGLWIVVFIFICIGSYVVTQWSLNNTILRMIVQKILGRNGA